MQQYIEKNEIEKAQKHLLSFNTVVKTTSPEAKKFYRGVSVLLGLKKLDLDKIFNKEEIEQNR